MKNTNTLNELREKRDEYINIHKWHSALNVVDEMIKISPTPSSYTRRGMLFMKLKDFGSAIDSFKMALKMDSSYERAREILVKLSARMDETCIEAYQHLLRPTTLPKDWNSSDVSMTHFDIKPTESSIIPLVDMNDTEIIEITPLPSQTTIAEYPIKTKKINKKFGPYQVIEVIGVGGMGKVYKAYHPELEREVAVKVMHADIECEKQRKRFFTEAKLMAKLHHPNIVSIHDVGTLEEQHYIVMDYVKGHSLRALILKKSLSFKESVEIVRLIALAMEYAHRNGIVHRDLKPANIMLDEDTRLPVVMDFGLAKNLQPSGDVTKSGEILGTPRYMAPEQAEGKQSLISAVTDVYALGTVMYELLTHTSAVAGNDPASIIYNILYHEVIPLRKINPKLSPGLEAICLKCLEKNPQHRYKSAKALADDIERLLNGEMIVARRLGFPQKVIRKIRYHKSTFILSGIFVLLLITFGVSLRVLQVMDRKNRIESLRMSAQQNINDVTGFKNLKEKFPNVSEDATAKKQLQNEVEESIYRYMGSRLFLEQALVLSPDDKTLKSELYQVEKEIGLLALLGQNYILSELSFSRCESLIGSEQDEVKELHVRVQKQKDLQRDQNLELLRNTMEQIKNVPPEAGMLDEYITEMVRMGESYIVRGLIPYLKYGNKWQKTLAIESLGKIGDRNTKYKGEDVVQCLVEELKTVDVHQDMEIAEKLVWSLGRLHDSRANEIVDKIRNDAGQYSVFWNRTIVPYKWIPIDNKELETAEEYYERGKKWYLKGDRKKAIQDFSKTIKLNPNYIEAYNGRGICHHDENLIEQAIADYSLAIGIDKNYFKAYNNRGICYQEKQEFDNAIVDYSKAIEISPDFHFSYANRALCYKEQNKIEKAIQDYNSAIEISPANEDYYSGRGDCYRQKGDFAKSLTDHSIAIQVNPKYVDAYVNRALCYKEFNQIDNAINDYSTAIQIDSAQARIYIDRAKCYKLNGNLTNAINDCTIAIQIDGKEGIGYLERGAYYELQGTLDKALKDYSKFIALKPSLDGYFQRAILYTNKKNNDLAMADFKKCLSFPEISKEKKQLVQDYLEKLEK